MPPVRRWFCRWLSETSTSLKANSSSSCGGRGDFTDGSPQAPSFANREMWPHVGTPAPPAPCPPRRPPRCLRQAKAAPRARLTRQKALQGVFPLSGLLRSTLCPCIRHASQSDWPSGRLCGALRRVESARERSRKRLTSSDSMTPGQAGFCLTPSYLS